MAANKEQFLERTIELLAEEKDNVPVWWYLSFADDSGFLGGVVIEAKGMMHARFSLSLFGIESPGGELMAFELPSDAVPPAKFRNKLLTKSEVLEMWPDAKSIREMEEEKQ